MTDIKDKSEVSTETMQDCETLRSLVGAFIGGRAAKLTNGDSFVSGGTLYADKDNALAKRTPNGTVLLFTPPSLSEFADINDTLIASLATGGLSYTRANNTLQNALNVTLRLADLENGNYERFQLFSGLLGLTVTDGDLATIKQAKELKASFQGHFTSLADAERKSRLAAEAAKHKESEKKIYEEWDSGKGQSYNAIVYGAGNNGRRLRLKVSPTGIRNVETSGGGRTSASAVLAAWKKVVPRWYEGKGGFSYYDTNGGRTVYLQTDAIKYGCQSVSKAECERFADMMGWPRTSEALKTVSESRKTR